MAEGFAVGSLAGVVVGASTGLFRTLREMVDPLFLFLAQVPTLGWIPLLILAVGIDEGMKVTVIAWSSFVAVALNVAQGMRDVPPGLRELGRVLTFDPWFTLTRVVLPAAVPQIFLAYRQVALFAWVPLLSMWFGGGETGKLAFVSLSAFAPVVVNTWRATKAVPQRFRELAAALTFRRLYYLQLVAFPGALPGIVTGLRTALIYAWIATVGAELFLDIAPGLGGRLNEGRDKFEVDLMLVALLLLAVLGLVCSRAAVFAEARLLRWRTR